MPPAEGPDEISTAFVLGGGGVLGSHEVGMLRALFERQVIPDVVVGTSIGAMNGAFVAAEPTLDSVDRLTELWRSIDESGVFSTSILGQLRTLSQTYTHLHDNEPLRRLVAEALPIERVENLAVRFECVAASIERASVHYFSDGPLVDAVLASCAVPGLFPPVEIDGEHFLDGGLVASIPLDRAVELGAKTVFVLQVGRVEEALTVPTRPWEVAMVAFEISRRHRFEEALRSLPPDVEVHVLPTGEPKAFNDLKQYRYRATGAVEDRIERSYEASLDYLDRL